MSAKKKSLQKLTEVQAKVNKLLKQKQIAKEEVEEFSEQESDELYKVMNEKFNSLKGVALDEFIAKVDALLHESEKNQLWEYNHTNITCAISKLMQQYGRMPHKNELAQETGLSRQTIHKHLKEYATHPQYLSQMEQFRFMTSKVLARVFAFAVQGDMKAAKLYLDVIGNSNEQKSNGRHRRATPSDSTLVQQQNNYIQINGMVLSQEAIKQLNAEQLNSIEAILKTAIPQPETLKAEQ